MVCKLIGCNLNVYKLWEKAHCPRREKKPDQKASNDVADWKWEKKRA